LFFATAAQCHLRLHLQSFLPRAAIVGTADEYDDDLTHEHCASDLTPACAAFRAAGR